MVDVRIWFAIDYVRLIWRRRKYHYNSPHKKWVVIALIEHLGDVVACEPVSRYVRRKYPGAWIMWVVRKPYRELILSNPNIDEALVVRCLTEWIYLRQTHLFDEVIDLHIQSRVCPTCRIPLLKSCGNLEITLANYFFFGNLLEVYCQCAGIPILQERPRVYIPSSIVSHVDMLALPANYVVIHRISNEPVKDWPLAKWQDLVRRLIRNRDLTVVDVGTHSDVVIGSSTKYIDLCGKLSILETAEVIRRARLFVGVDSGPAHLANAVGTFGIILMGSYRAFRRYIPFCGEYGISENVEIIYEDGLVANIGVERVYQSIERKLGQSLCVL